MKKSLSLMAAGAGLCLAGAAYGHDSATHQKATPMANQSQSSDQQRQKQQAKQSEETPAHTEFGGQAKDQEARERHHQQYPDIAQQLGPQGGDKGQAQEGHTRREDKKQDAVSGVGH
jgi:hypothetical protein